MIDYDLTPDIKKIKGKIGDESEKEYLNTLNLLSLCYLSYKNNKDKLEEKRVFDDCYFSFLPYFARRFPSISLSAFSKAELISFSIESMALGSIKEFTLFITSPNSINLTHLLMAFRYFLTIVEKLNIDL